MTNIDFNSADDALNRQIRKEVQQSLRRLILQDDVKIIGNGYSLTAKGYIRNFRNKIDEIIHIADHNHRDLTQDELYFILQELKDAISAIEKKYLQK